MDRLQSELLVAEESYIQANVTIGEFIARIEPAIGGDSARRLYALLECYLNEPMPNVSGESPIPSPEDRETDE